MLRSCANTKRLLATAVGLMMLVCPALAGKVVLRITAGNKLNLATNKEIKVDLPIYVRTNDILSLGGLDLGYDINKGTYFVQKTVDLGPKEIKPFEVQINDIWTIPKTETEALRTQVRALMDKLDARAKANAKLEASLSTSEELRQFVERDLKAIEESQAANAIKPGVTVEQHIMAYESDAVVLKGVRLNIRKIENYVLAAGEDPGMLVDDGRYLMPPPRKDVTIPSYSVALYRVTVTNTSPLEKRKLQLTHDLPMEIKSDDILDAAGLQVETDPKTGVVRLKIDRELAARQAVSFNLKIRDKWNINQPRARELKITASNLLSRISAKTSKDRYMTIESSLNGLLGELDGILAEQGPKELGRAYVEYYREQAGRVDVIEQKVARIDSVMKQSETGTIGFSTQAPSPKTTWLLIYIILGFLALMSLVFFFRWMGKSEADVKGQRSEVGDQKSAGGDQK